jgi:hypothetical protein
MSSNDNNVGFAAKRQNSLRHLSKNDTDALQLLKLITNVLSLIHVEGKELCVIKELGINRFDLVVETLFSMQRQQRDVLEIGPNRRESGVDPSAEL